jgi:hypothetical protein
MSTSCPTTIVKIQRKGGVVVQGCDVYIGRAQYQGGWALPASKWGNPFSSKKLGSEVCIVKYLRWITHSDQKQLLEVIPNELKGKVLGCWCKIKGTESCHGDVLIYLADGTVSPSFAHCLTVAGEKGVDYV